MEDEFPEKEITVIVPFAAGGGSDVFVRIFQEAIRKNELCPHPIVVKNVSGGRRNDWKPHGSRSETGRAYHSLPP